MQILKTTSVLLTLGTAAAADVPNVVTDIAPIQSIVAGVMGDLGQPKMLVDANQDAHNFALRPSQARDIQNADVIIWIGESLLPFLPDTFASLASSVSPVALIDVVSEDKLLDWGDEYHDDHGEKDGHDDHDHAGHDPHIWLDPSLMIDVVPAIAQALSTADPENAATYAANAQAVIADMTALKPEITTILTQQTRPILALHDSLGYYETAFPVIKVLAIPESDGANNSLDDAALLEQLIADENPACAMIEPFAENAGLSVLSERNGVPLKPMDVMGRDFDMGADRYRNMMIALAIAIASCGE